MGMRARGREKPKAKSKAKSKAKAKARRRKPTVKAENNDAPIKIALAGVLAFAVVLGYGAYRFSRFLDEAHASDHALGVFRNGIALALPAAFGVAVLAGLFLLVQIIIGKDPPRQ